MKIEDTAHLLKCNSCRFFVKFANHKYLGWCHRNAPLPNSYSKSKEQELYDEVTVCPTVSSVFWCGQHKKLKRSTKRVNHSQNV